MANYKETNKETYERWLLHCVLILGWTTVKCAREVKAKPKDVLKDFNRLIGEIRRGPKINPRKP